jgi:hypothetical protein
MVVAAIQKHSSTPTPLTKEIYIGIVEDAPCHAKQKINPDLETICAQHLSMQALTSKPT